MHPYVLDSSGLRIMYDNKVYAPYQNNHKALEDEVSRLGMELSLLKRRNLEVARQLDSLQASFMRVLLAFVIVLAVFVGIMVLA